MEKICAAFDCDNVIRSNNGRKRFCQPSCKTRQHRYGKSDTGAGVTGFRSSAKPSGNVVADLSLAAMKNGLENAVGDKPLVNGLGTPVLSAGLPYLGECVKKRPLLSLLFFGLGHFAGDMMFSSCSTTVTAGQKGTGSKKVKKCTNATGIQKAGSGASAVLAFSYLCDNWSDIAPRLANVTLQKRYSNGTVTPVTVNNGTSVPILFGQSAS